ISEVGVVGHARPVGGADGAWKDDCQFRSVMRVGTTESHSSFGGKKVRADFFLLWCHVCNVFRAEAVATDRGRLYRKWFGRPTEFTGHIARRNRSLFNSENGLA